MCVFLSDSFAQHCQALLAIKRLEFWLSLTQGPLPAPLLIAALHLLESLAKNVAAVRSKNLPQLQGVETLCRVLLESESQELTTAAMDCLEEVCRGTPANLALALQALQVWRKCLSCHFSHLFCSRRRRCRRLFRGRRLVAARDRIRASAREGVMMTQTSGLWAPRRARQT
jgi:hypothetical protein